MTSLTSMFLEAEAVIGEAVEVALAEVAEVFGAVVEAMVVAMNLVAVEAFGAEVEVMVSAEEDSVEEEAASEVVEMVSAEASEVVEMVNAAASEVVEMASAEDTGDVDLTVDEAGLAANHHHNEDNVFKISVCVLFIKPGLK
jgi:hypothetical protein